MTRQVMRELALFAGAGGGILGGLACGFRTVCAVELAEYPRRVLLARQRDGYLPRFPIWDDVCTFDGRPWRGHVDVITGGFPCQDISQAGTRTGISGAKSGLWREFARIIGEVRPRFAFIENSADLRSRGIEVVLADIAALGYDAEWMVLGASDVGAPHVRPRLWILAHSDLPEQRMGAVHAQVAVRAELTGHDGWPRAPGNPRVAHGMAHRMDRVRATGNGQVARVATVAWAELLRRAHERTEAT